MQTRRSEGHRIQRVAWLRAAVLGANDGIVSTSSLVMGVAAASGARSDVLIAGVAGLVAGAASMAAGEYVSVSSQADSERADIERERDELENDVEFEHEELASIYVARGVDAELATQVASQLMSHDALGAHARDELGITDTARARPVQAALASAAAFAVGAVMPLMGVASAPDGWVTAGVAGSTLVLLAVLGSTGAWAGGAPMTRAAIRVTVWGALAMALTAGVGKLFGAVV